MSGLYTRLDVLRAELVAELERVRRGGATGHAPGAHRARRHGAALRGPGPAPPGRGRPARVRPAAGGRRRGAVHRPHRPARRRPAAAAARLAGAAVERVLPGHRGDAARRADPPPPDHTGPGRHRARGRGLRPRGHPRGRARSTARRRCSPRSARSAPAGCTTSSRPSRRSRTASSARRRAACSSCRAAPAPARPPSRCTAPPTSCTPTRSGSPATACSSSARRGASSSTSSRCCPRSGETGVVLRTLGQLYPGVDAGAVDPPAVAGVKGRTRHGDRAATRGARQAGRTVRAGRGRGERRRPHRAAGTDPARDPARAADQEAAQRRPGHVRQETRSAT